MRKHKSIIKNKNGFTMVEILLVMGFIALASISTYVLYDDVKAAYVADAEIKNLGTLLERIDKSYDSVSTYSAISLEHVKELNIPIVWGGDWKTFKDGPHFELDRNVYK